MIINVLIENPAHLNEVLEVAEVSGIYLPGERLSSAETARLARRCRERGKKCYYAFPYVFRREARQEYEACVEELAKLGCDGWLIRSLDEAGFVRELGLPGERIFDAGVYAWNSMAAEQLRLWGADVLTAPYELNERELRGCGYAAQGAAELVVYGHLPVMLSAQCVTKTTRGCRRDEGGYSIMRLRDRKGASFLAENRCHFCYNVIYNSVPLWLLDQEAAFPERIRFQFTAEEAGEPSRLLRAFVRGERGPQGSFTRGHFMRGVE